LVIHEYPIEKANLSLEVVNFDYNNLSKLKGISEFTPIKTIGVPELFVIPLQNVELNLKNYLAINH
jgi:hypothetical protein